MDLKQVLLLCLICVIVGVVQGKDCTADDIRGVYTECQKTSNTRKVVYYYAEGCDVGVDTPSLPTPIHDLACDISCPGSTYLPLGETACEDCEAGYFSLGGATVYSNWTSATVLPTTFTTSCTGHENCSAWEVSGGYLDSGAQPAAAVDSILVYPVTLLRTGTVRFIYKVDGAAGYYRTNSLVFSVDDLTELQETSVLTWTTAEFPLSAGSHVLEWRFVQNQGSNDTDYTAYIKSIAVVGTDYSDDSCTPCPSGYYSDAAASACTICESNTYSVSGSGKCEDCPAGEYAPPGSTACLPREPCVAADFEPIYTPCASNGTRRLLYTYALPLVCNKNGAGSLTPDDIPEHNTELPCPACEAGAYRSVDVGADRSTCVACPAGQYSPAGSTAASDCSPCEAGTFGLSTLSYTEFALTETTVDSVPVGFETGCSGDCPTAGGSGGWRFHSRFIDSGEGYGEDVTVYLNTTVTIRTEGAFTFQYMIKGQDSTSCSLKVYVDDMKVSSYYCTAFDMAIYLESETITLTQGTHNLKWVFSRSVPSAATQSVIANLANVTVTDVVDAPVASCEKCLAGYSSTAGSLLCGACNPGEYAPQPGSAVCSPCDDGQFSAEFAATECLSCVTPYTSNPTHTGCVETCAVTFGDYAYNLTALSSTSEMYGHIIDQNGHEYFFNPCSKEHSNHTCIDRNGDPIPTFGCQITKNEYGVDLGSNYGFVAREEEASGVVMMMQNGEKGCGSVYGLPQPRTTNITFICDGREGLGSPTVPDRPVEYPDHSCHYELEWRTRYACPLCTARDYTMTVGSCDPASDNRTVEYQWIGNPKQCHGGVELPAPRTIPCTVQQPCTPGHYAPVSDSGATAACEPVPAGYFSLGNARHYDGFDAVSPAGFLTTPFQTSCENSTVSANCEGWSVQDGTFVSGKQGLTSVLEMSLDFLQPGTVTVTFSAIVDDTVVTLPGSPALSQGLHFYLGRTLAHSHTTNTLGAETFTLAVNEAGSLTLSIVHVRSQTGPAAHTAAAITAFVVKGTESINYKTPCPPGSYSPADGASTCTQCPAGTYNPYEGQSACSSCSSDFQWSPVGAVECRKKEALCQLGVDVLPHYSPCAYNASKVRTRTVSYVWNSPVVCKTNPSLVVPEPTVEECPAPGAGMHVNDQTGQSEPCPRGYSSTPTPAGRQCVACDVGKAAIPSLYVDQFSPETSALPLLGFSTGCVGLQCNSTSPGWATQETHLHSGIHTGEEITTFFTLRVTRLSLPKTFQASVSLTYSLILNDETPNTTQMSVMFAVFGCQKELLYLTSTPTTAPVSVTLPLSATAEGEKCFLRVEYIQANPQARSEGGYAVVSALSFFGVDEGWGVEECSVCSNGLYSGAESATTCKTCGVGHVSGSATEGVSVCLPCPLSYFARYSGLSECEPCGVGTSTTSTGMGECSTNGCTVATNTSSYSLAALAQTDGSGNTAMLSLGSLTLNSSQSGTMYLSVCGLDSRADRPCVAGRRAGFRTFACLETKDKDGATSVVDLGGVINYIAAPNPDTTTSESVPVFSVVLSDGDIEPETESPYEVTVDFFCDLDSGVGAPERNVFAETTANTLHFKWLSRYACPKCSKDDYEFIWGECNGGEKTGKAVLKKGARCYADDAPDPQAQSCDEIIVGNSTVYLAAAVVVGLCAVSGLLCFRHRKLSQDYQQLKAVQTRDGEMAYFPSGAETVGDDENEEEEEDGDFMSLSRSAASYAVRGSTPPV